MMNEWPFESLLGQPYAFGVLRQALQSRHLSGSYLFVGPDGVGKTTAARQFAKALTGAVSEVDPRSRQIDSGTSPDVREIGPQGAGRMISIAQLWPRDHKEFRAEEAMLRDLSFEPITGQKRVFIIKDAEGLNEASGNSLLKTLEEPPAYAHLILTAVSTASVLPTILSRCQLVRFSTLSAGDIEQILREKYTVPAAQARFLSLYSEGRLGRAVALAHSPALLSGRDQILDITRDLVSAPAIKSFKLSEEFRKAAPKLKAADDAGDLGGADGEDKSSRAATLRALDLIATYLRDLLALRVLGEAQAHPVNADRLGELAAAAPSRTVEQWERAITLLLGLRFAVERNANAQIAIDVLFTNLCQQA